MIKKILFHNLIKMQIITIIIKLIIYKIHKLIKHKSIKIQTKILFNKIIIIIIINQNKKDSNLNLNLKIILKLLLRQLHQIAVKLKFDNKHKIQKTINNN